jgi:hypothetical protein
MKTLFVLATLSLLSCNGCRHHAAENRAKKHLILLNEFDSIEKALQEQMKQDSLIINFDSTQLPGVGASTRARQ